MPAPAVYPGLVALGMVVGAVFLVLVFAAVPALVRAQVRGRTAAIGLGMTPDGVGMDAGGGLRQVSIPGELSARVIEASLRDEGLEVELFSHSGDGVGGLAATYYLLYRADDEPRVMEAVAHVVGEP